MVKKSNNQYVIITIALLVFCSMLFVLLNRRSIEGFSSNDVKVRIEYFYMDGCPYCKEFDSTWNELVKSNPENVQLVSYNINKNSERASKFNINSAPTVVAVDIKSDTVVNLFNEARTIANLKKFVSMY